LGEVSIVAVDHRDARAHEARDGEHGYSGPEREGGVGVAQVVEAAERLDTGLDLCPPPVLASEDPEGVPAAARVRKQDRVVRRWEPVERFERLRLERHRPRARPGLGVLEPAVRVGAADVDDAGSTVDVALLKSEPFRGPEPGRCGEDDHRPVHPPELRSHGFDLPPPLERPLLRRPRAGFGTPRVAGL
jgi:hypothetical protein